MHFNPRTRHTNIMARRSYFSRRRRSYRLRRRRMFGRRRIRSYRRYGRNKYRRRINARSGLIIRRTFVVGGISPQTNNPQSLAWSFKLSDMPGYAQYCNLYDTYKLAAVKLTFWPNNQVNISNAIQPRIVYAIDYDDSNTGQSEPTLLSYANSRIRNLVGPPFSVYFKPRFARSTYQSTTSTGYTPGRGYIDTNDASVPHYGFKAVIPAADSIYRTLIYATFYVKFRSPRMISLGAIDSVKQPDTDPGPNVDTSNTDTIDPIVVEH